MGVGGQHNATVALPPGKTRYPLWVGPRAGLDGCGKSRPRTGIRSPDRRARSENALCDRCNLCCQTTDCHYSYHTLESRTLLSFSCCLWCRELTERTSDVMLGTNLGLHACICVCIYIYIYMCVCVCVCVCEFLWGFWHLKAVKLQSSIPQDFMPNCNSTSQHKRSKVLFT